MCAHIHTHTQKELTQFALEWASNDEKLLPILNQISNYQFVSFRLTTVVMTRKCFYKMKSKLFIGL